MAEFDEYEASQSFFEDEEQECFDGERSLGDGKESARYAMLSDAHFFEDEEQEM